MTTDYDPEESTTPRVQREKKRILSVKSDTFNENGKQNTYLFLSTYDEGSVTAGVIVEGNVDERTLFDEFLRAVELELTDVCLEEVTFCTLRNMLRRAAGSGLLRDDDEILERFDLEILDSRGGVTLDYGENILKDSSKKELYAEAERLFARDSFLPELDRIYAGSAKTEAIGHPVHYMVQTDDRKSRREMYLLLLRALYANRRLRNRRYCFLNFRPGEDFSQAAYDSLYKSCIGGAIVVRYLANDDTEDRYASADRDTVETLCETMKKYRNQVLTVFCLPRECTKAKDIFYENLGSVCIVELKEEFVSGERAERFLRMLAADSHVRPDEKLFSRLEPDKGYLAPALREIFDSWFNDQLKTGVYPQYRDIAAANREVLRAAPKGSAYDELNRMVGLEEAKQVIDRALNYYKAQKLFAEKGMKLDKPAMHMVFTGNPGTAKTSVARLFARIMQENGLLSKGELIEVGRGDLVGKYVGWTAATVKKKFSEAMGSVLFIDEAYSLVDDRDGSFGDEAINTIVQEMENHRKDLVVIFAGYPDKMERFLQKNPGLRSRIAYHVPFRDYSTEALCKIAGLIAAEKGLTLTPGAQEKLTGIFDAAGKESDFGNGRYVRNVIDRARMAQATRLLAMDLDAIGAKDVSTLCAEDIELPQAPAKEASRRIGFGTA